MSVDAQPLGSDPFDAVFASGDCRLRHSDGSVEHWPVNRWCAVDVDPADLRFDAAVAHHCVGSTIDLGCGPGRLLDALTARDMIALGVDSSAVAVTMARRRGRTVLQRDIHEPLPGEGRWTTALVIDGNVGIGGDPTRVLTRAGEIVRPGGTILVEIDPAVEHVEREMVRVETSEVTGSWFPWARIGLLGAENVAHASGLSVRRTWEESGRQVVEMSHR